MPGFTHAGLEDIGRIRDLLERQYSSSLAVIELLQNADDRRARQVVFAWHRGFPDAASPLLRGPQLFAINDGEFKSEDGHAIQRLGAGAKGADAASIGKYGLGLKVVFHFGEAFYWGATGVPAKLLNPWFGSGKHEEWERQSVCELDAAIGSLAAELGFSRWFFIAVPLRVSAKDHLQGLKPIESSFPGDAKDPPDEVFGRQIARGLAICLPLLRHVESVLWLRSDGRSTVSLHRLRLAPRATRRNWPGDDAACAPGEWPRERNERQFDGSGVLSHEADSHCREIPFSYVGREVALGRDPELANLPKDAAWPTSTVVRDDGSSDHVPDPAWPTAAVCILSWGTSSGHTKAGVAWHAFTPVGDGDNSHVPAEGFDVQVALHGYFFVDAGRRALTAATKNDGDLGRVVREKWNRLLRTEGTLPLLPSVLSDYARHTGATSEQIEAVTAALLAAPDFDREAASGEDSWVLRHGAQSSWQTVTSTSRFVQIPHPSPAILADLDRLVPGLSSTVGGRVAVYKGVPGITRRDPEVLGQDELAMQLLPDDFDLVTRDEVLQSIVDYLVQLVRLTLRCAPESSGASGLVGAALSARLVRLVQSLASRGHLRAGTGGATSAAERMLKLLPAAASLYVLAPSRDVQEGFYRFAFDERSPVVVRRGPAPPEHRVAMDPLAAAGLIGFVQTLRGVSDAERSKLAVSVLAQLDQSTRQAALGDAADACLFDVKVNGGERRMASWHELENAFGQGTLFLEDPSSHASELAACVDGIFTEIPELAAAALFEGRSPPPVCDATRAVERVLSARTVSPAAASRRLMLERLLAMRQPPDGTDRAIRYLLHGHRASHDDHETELLADAVGATGALSSLLRHVLGTAGSWRIVEELASCLSPTHASRLRVTTLSAAVVSTEVERQTEVLDPGAITEEDRQELLKGLSLPALSRLRIHRTVDGEFVAADDRVYLPGDALVPPSLAGRVFVLAPEADPGLRVRQEALVGRREFNVSVALGLLLKQECSQAVGIDILETIRSVCDGPLPADVRDALRSTAWVATPGGPQKPCGVVDGESAAWVGEKLLVAARPHLVFADTLGAWLTTHPAWGKIASQLLPNRGELVQILATAMSTDPELRLGIEEGEVTDLLDAMKELEFPQGARALHRPRGLDLVEAAIRQRVARPSVEIAARTICGATTEECLRDVLRAIPDAQGAAAEKDGVACLHLRALGRMASSREALRGLRLLSRAGRWVDAAKLCVETPGAADDAQLSPAHAQALGRIWDMPGAIPDRPTEVEAESLAEYLKRWPRSATTAVGTFLALLGEGPDVRGLARKYVPDDSRVNDMRESLLGESGQRKLEQLRLAVTVVPSTDQIRVVNLLGESIAVPPPDEPDHLLAGKPTLVGPGTYGVRVRAIEVESRSLVELSALLRETVRQLLGCLNITPRNLDQGWERLCLLSQELDITVARRMIVEDSIVFLRQLGLTRALTLGKALDRVNEARRGLAEAEAHRPPEVEQPSTQVARAKKAYREARSELEWLIENKAAAQREILDAICRKIRTDYQYGPDRVLFELFQNADDAVAQGAQLDGRANVGSPASACRFVAGIERDCVWVAHWGRNVNECQVNTVDMRDRGFDRDLENMLVFSTSEKVTGDVTGKFGLGFKSVFLLSPCPRFRSGRLAVEILGGVLPRLLTEKAATELDSRLAAAGGAQQDRGTLLLLPGVPQDQAQHVVDEFAACAPILAAFALSIRSVEIKTVDKGWTEHFVWDARCFGGVEWSTRQDPDGTSEAHLLSPAGGRAGLLLATRRGLIDALPARVPTIWCTAPTGERYELGFALNGRFELDVGRAQIARAVERNGETARSMGEVLGQALVSLFDALGTGEDVALPWCSGPVREYEFWDSFWNVVAAPLARALREREGRPPGLEILRRVLCADDSVGIRHLFADRCVVPTQMLGGLRRLVRLGDIRVEAAGILTRPEVCAAVGALPGTAKVLPPGAVVSAGVVRDLIDLGILRTELPEVRLAAVLHAVLVGSPVSPRAARTLGAILYSGQERIELDATDEAELRELVSNLVFLVREGPVRPASDVVVLADGDNEEARVARFAPASFLLSGDYDQLGVRFLGYCRRREWSGDSELVQRWALAAHDEESRKAVLEYVDKGHYAREVARYLRENDCPWAGDAVRILGESSLDEAVKLAIANLIGATPPPTRGPESDTGEPRATDVWATDWLEQIATWWKSDRNAKLRRYERQTYPNGRPYDLSASDDLDTPEPRERWIGLLTLGCLQSMGRARPRAHRKFLELCREKDWLATLADPNRRCDLLSKIDAFAADRVRRVEWLHWMKHLVGPYIASKNLEDHVRALLAMDTAREAFDLEDYLAPRSNPDFSGGGPDAPPLVNVLGIGSHLVVRDLRRSGVLRSAAVDRHCYTPSKRVFGLFRFCDVPPDSFGRSVRIWEAVRNRLGDGSFFGDYDIPILAALDDEKFRDRLRSGS